jgi:hypothetical protein
MTRSTRSKGMNWDRINAKEKARRERTFDEPQRHKHTAEGQRDEIRRLNREVGHPEPTEFPEMAYDAYLEIRRLQLRVESEQRRRERR